MLFLSTFVFPLLLSVAATTTNTSATKTTSSVAASTTTNTTAAKTTSSVAASTTTTTTTTTAKPNPKRGLAYAATNATDILKANSTASVASWVYTWSLNPPDNIVESGLEFIPMQWGAADIENLAVTMKGLGAKTLLAFNEPDFDQQSNINASYAAQLWMQYIEPLKADGIRLGAPAISSSGRDWLTDFMNECSQCTIDFIPFHWYGDGVGGFTDYLYQLHGQFNKTLWVTEWAETSTNDTVVLDFLNSTVAMLDSLDWVERYAWFGYFRPNDGSHYNLLDVNGNLNAAGQVYIDAATKVVNALPNPTGSGTGDLAPAPNTAGGGYTTVSPASDVGPTPAFATQTPSGGRRVAGDVAWGSLLFAVAMAFIW
ncbi:glycosyl hydrolase catalytic core-domain-containing protein [Roridomyces roridus]|uniref:Glycosyl hydrolase catalytic core-domain-containing protein n=1 Tax=Roridomyces roridus TaxID=1738132 RepID=A0AAD7CB81_9AGAR|nr:glycosyl hydrolase catalytic core-domain-containing protein [Roridomyces roridus]